MIHVFIAISREFDYIIMLKSQIFEKRQKNTTINCIENTFLSCKNIIECYIIKMSHPLRENDI